MIANNFKVRNNLNAFAALNVQPKARVIRYTQNDIEGKFSSDSFRRTRKTDNKSKTRTE